MLENEFYRIEHLEVVIIRYREEGCIGKYAPRGNLYLEAREMAIPRAEGWKLPQGRIFQFILTQGSVLPFFFSRAGVMDIIPLIAG